MIVALVFNMRMYLISQKKKLVINKATLAQVKNTRVAIFVFNVTQRVYSGNPNAK